VIRVRLSTSLGEWWGIVALITISGLCQPFAKHLSWNRDAIGSGQLWRLVTGNLCHGNLTHYLMNMLALVVIASLFQEHLRGRRGIGITIITTLLGSAALFASDYRDYVGLSGVLHGLVAYGALSDIYQRIALGWILLGGLSIKLAGEQFGFLNIGSSALIDLPVAIDAHLYFALCGGLVFFVFLTLKSRVDKSK
jgi:rhomboid family GlyGly-CTERM serine protease